MISGWKASGAGSIFARGHLFAREFPRSVRFRMAILLAMFDPQVKISQGVEVSDVMTIDPVSTPDGDHFVVRASPKF